MKRLAVLALAAAMMVSACASKEPADPVTPTPAPSPTDDGCNAPEGGHCL